MAASKRGSRRPGRRRPPRTKARRKASRRRPRPQARKARRRPAKATRKRASPRRQAKRTSRRRGASRPPRKPAGRHETPSVLSRARRQLSESERLTGPTSGMAPDRMMQSAKAGHDEMRIRLQRHTATSPELTAGDPDARWEDAYAVGDEAPGGDNPTPDQDRVDDIGKALGIRYRTDEELRGGDEVTERDRHRWELDPASSEDWPHEPKKKQ